MAGAASKPATLDKGSYYGVNYTVPFAHAYRALGQLGIDRREAIDRDVYHMARLGLNAFRLHLWDVELADGEGNLLAEGNDHLELLDYLIARLEERGIAVVLTAQTNFGNGYPERNTDPNGAFSYKYAKCDVHDNPAAQEAQERYLRALVNHVNPFTGKSYEDDPGIIAIEINNEPCHSGTAEQITAYIDRMSAALRDAGWKKEILYNVSHNLDRVEAYYAAADIDGTTYQCYPTGLVKGAQRHGNFLPMLDSYDIPWDTIKGFGSKSKVVYEYDPADVLDTYLYPAAVRTFRKAGFTWATQFAYDPIDMAEHNTEYQTHFLNLAYTPGKAIGMMIAAEAMRQIPKGADYGKYPADTVFGEPIKVAGSKAKARPFLVSASRNLAMLNDGERYYYTNNTNEAPIAPQKLRSVAGVGNSPLVTTDGTGAYFLDKLSDGLWRLEVMPDVIITDDPFAKPSLERSVAVVTERPIHLKINEEGLICGTAQMFMMSANADESAEPIFVDEGNLYVEPGVYLIGGHAPISETDWRHSTFGNGLGVREFVKPSKSNHTDVFVHNAPAALTKGNPLKLKAIWTGDEDADSIVVYPASANFWREKNRLYKMEKSGKYEYTVEIPAEAVKGDFKYRIVAYKDEKATTYPAAKSGTPLDWDMPETGMYSVKVVEPGAPIELLRAAENMDGSEITTIPEGWKGVKYAYESPMGQAPKLVLEVADDADTDLGVVTKYVAPAIKALNPGEEYDTLRIYLGKADGGKVGLVNADGFTYTAPIGNASGKGYADLSLDSFKLDSTVLAPAPYPAFLGRFFEPDPTNATPLRPNEIETVTFEAPRGSIIEIIGAELIKKNQ